MRVIRGLLLLILAGAAMFPAAAMAAEQVDLLLVLAADVSRSVDNEKFQLQREGYAAAVSDPHVLDAIRSGRTGRIGLTYVEWSGIGSQRVMIDWTTISDAEFGQGLWRSPLGGAALICGPHLDQRRDRVRHDPSGEGAVRIRPPHHRCLR